MSARFTKPIHDPTDVLTLGKSEWYRRACFLEEHGQLQEMETFVRQSVQAQEYALVIAAVYRQRMLRLRSQKNLAGAAVARAQAARTWPVDATHSCRLSVQQHRNSRAEIIPGELP
jgi:hypothetical protein